MFAFVIQGDDFVFAGTDMQQRNPQPVFDTHDQIFLSGTGLNGNTRFDTLETPCGNAHLVAFHKTLRFGDINREFIGIGPGDPLQIQHLLIGQIRVITALPVLYARQEIVLRQYLLHTIKLVLR